VGRQVGQSREQKLSRAG